MFPSMEKDVIKSILTANNGHKVGLNLWMKVDGLTIRFQSNDRRYFKNSRIKIEISQGRRIYFGIEKDIIYWFSLHHDFYARKLLCYILWNMVWFWDFRDFYHFTRWYILNFNWAVSVTERNSLKQDSKINIHLVGLKGLKSRMLKSVPYRQWPPTSARSSTFDSSIST